MNTTGYRSRVNGEAEQKRQRDLAAMELTYVQIQMLPVTTDCPDEEKMT